MPTTRVSHLLVVLLRMQERRWRWRVRVSFVPEEAESEIGDGHAAEDEGERENLT